MTQSPSLSVPVRHVSPGDERGKEMCFCLDFPTLAVVPHGGLGIPTTSLSTSPAQSHKHHSVPSLAYTMTATLVSRSQCSALHLIAKLLLKLKKKKKIKKEKKQRGGWRQSSRALPGPQFKGTQPGPARAAPRGCTAGRPPSPAFDGFPIPL